LTKVIFKSWSWAVPLQCDVMRCGGRGLTAGSSGSLPKGQGRKVALLGHSRAMAPPPPREGRPGESTAGRPGDPFIREEPAMCW